MIIHGDSLDELKKLAENSVDAVVTDPPYGWRFMGKAWDAPDIAKMAASATGKEPRLCADGKMRPPRADCKSIAAGAYDNSPTGNQAFQIWTEAWAREALRVLKPGGHALIFCGPRTYHRMASGVEDAGFEIRDQLQWLFGSGFPKSHNIGEGRGTALKPANEPIVLARKPLSESTVAKNVLKWNTGCLNIDAGRIVSQWENAEHLCSSCAELAEKKTKHGVRVKKVSTAAKLAEPTLSERANHLQLGISKTDTGCSAGTTTADTDINLSTAKSGNPSTAQFPLDTLSTTSMKTKPTTELKTCSLCGAESTLSITSQSMQAAQNATPNTPNALASKGRWPSNCLFDEDAAVVLDEQQAEVSRFFYVAKTSKRERNAGLEGMPARFTATMNDGIGMREHNENEPRAYNQNHHPTVKPIKLMEYLIRLVTPPSGTVLDPFMGSGSTGVAAKRLGFEFIGIEREAEYVEIARHRIEHAQNEESA